VTRTYKSHHPGYYAWLRPVCVRLDHARYGTPRPWHLIVTGRYGEKTHATYASSLNAAKAGHRLAEALGVPYHPHDMGAQP
jgi:hypothetical protein